MPVERVDCFNSAPPDTEKAPLSSLIVALSGVERRRCRFTADREVENPSESLHIGFTMNLIILTESDRNDETKFTVVDKRADHIREVLRAVSDDNVEVGMIDGPVGTARVLEVSLERVVLEVTDWRAAPGLEYEVELVCAVPRPKTLKKVLTVCAMMGVRAVHFVRANRTDKSYLDSPLLLPENSLQYFIDGLSQGKMTRVPKTHFHPLFRPFVEDGLPALYPKQSRVARLLPEPAAGAKLTAILADSQPENYVLAIGPEGGWVPFELDLLMKAGFRPFSLGPWMLRVETAVTAALAQLELVSGGPGQPARPQG